MLKHTLSLSIIIIGIVVAAVHVTALIFSLYWVYWWLDIVMHFLGGLLVAMFGIWFYEKFQKETLFNGEDYKVLLNVIIFVTIVGLFWETFELFFDATSTTKVAYVRDTIFDFVMNTVGTITGFFYAKYIIKKIRE